MSVYNIQKKSFNFSTQNYKLHNPPNPNAYKLKVEWNDDKSPTHMSLNIEGVTIYLWCIDSYEDLQWGNGESPKQGSEKNKTNAVSLLHLIRFHSKAENF